MTQQMSDRLLFEGVSCELICWAGGELFDPFAHGLQPVRNCTALDRGVLAHYRVDERLWLDELMLDHALPGPPERKPRLGRGPAINGVSPRTHPDMGFTSHYPRLDLPLDFDGGLLIGELGDGAGVEGCVARDIHREGVKGLLGGFVRGCLGETVGIVVLECGCEGFPRAVALVRVGFPRALGCQRPVGLAGLGAVQGFGENRVHGSASGRGGAQSRAGRA